jgi:hypothetical protein
MKAERLAWDSDFFGKEIFSIHTDAHELLNDPDALRREIKEAQRDGAQLIYVFVAEPLGSGVTWSPCLVDQPADIKVVYSKELTGGDKADALILAIHECRDASALYELAYRAGHKSRFRDVRLGGGKFKEMYRAWIDNSISGKMATNVLAYHADGKPVGLVTLKIDGDAADIGLLAVSEEHAGRGIGAHLMAYTERICKANGVKTLHVATQEANTGACRFYEKSGYRPTSRSAIYHIWTDGMCPRKYH